ncbi:unnamed protein product [Auanema sp. JU1783]|nr:unnamed protein product [Auanema sp. JU1783]
MGLYNDDNALPLRNRPCYSNRHLISRGMYNKWEFKILSTLGAIVHLLLIDIPKDLFRWLTLKQKDVRGKTIVITGAGSGLGKRMAELFSLHYGANVACLDVNLKSVEEAVKGIIDQGGNAIAFQCDISSVENMNEIAKRIESIYGNVDIVICNAAVLAFKFFMDLSSEELKRSFDVNVIGTVNTIRAFLGEMEKRNDGQIVSVASIAGFYGETYGLAYCPSKFAVRGVMECLQMELRDMGLEGIKCTTLCPYFARTPMVCNAGLRPTCTWFPFMSIDSCSRRMVDDILKEKVLSFVPSYVTLTVLFKGLMSINVGRTLREYLGIKYDPSNTNSERKLLPTPPDYYECPCIGWWMIIPLAMLFNFYIWWNPVVLAHPLLPIIGEKAASFGLQYPVLAFISNVIFLGTHLAEAIYVMTFCDSARFSLACSFKWFLQTFLLGYPSLTMLISHLKNENKEC